jgi:hypothetical protein
MRRATASSDNIQKEIQNRWRISSPPRKPPSTHHVPPSTNHKLTIKKTPSKRTTPRKIATSTIAKI